MTENVPKLRIDTQSDAFLYIKNEQLKFEIKKHIYHLYEENYKL